MTSTTKDNKKGKKSPRGVKKNGGKEEKKKETNGRIAKKHGIHGRNAARNTGENRKRNGTRGVHTTTQWKTPGNGEETNMLSEEEKEDTGKTIT